MTTSIAITAGGLAVMVLPSLIVGNEVLILGGVGAAVRVWFFSHRHDQLRGLVDATKQNLLTLPDSKSCQTATRLFVSGSDKNVKVVNKDGLIVR